MSVHSINVGAGRHHGVILSCVATAAFMLVISTASFAQDKSLLPPDFKVPRPIAEFMQDNEGDERTSDEAIVQWQKTVRAHLALALQAKKLDDKIQGTQLTAKEIIEETCRIRVRKLSLKSLRSQLKTTRIEIYRDIHLNAKVKDVRDFALKTIVDEAQKLMDGHLIVRLQAVQLLSELIATEADDRKRPPTPAYLSVESLPVLLKIMADPKQPEAVHISAAAGVEKLLREGNLPLGSPPSKPRVEAAQALIKALKTPGLSTWYQQVLVLALPSVGLPTIPDAGGIAEPAIAKALLEIVGDRKRPLSVRCMAVRALGKSPLPPTGVSAAAISKSILELTFEVVSAYNKAQVTPLVGALLLQDIYYGLAGDKALVIIGLRNSPLAGTKEIQDTYKAVVPLLKHALKNVQAPQIVPIPKADVTSVEQFIGPAAVKALTPAP